MQTIKVDCPYCSMDYAVTLIPGRQEHKCLNCGHNFIVNIDDDYRVDVRREENFSEVPYYETFIEQFIDVLRDNSWELLGGHSKTIDIIAKKDMGFGYSLNLIGIINGDNFRDIKEVQDVFDEFYEFIVQNTSSSSNITHPSSGLLLLTFSNAYKTEIDDESREIEQHSKWKGIYASVGAFDFSKDKFLNPKTSSPGDWNRVVPPLLAKVDLKKLR